MSDVNAEDLDSQGAEGTSDDDTDGAIQEDVTESPQEYKFKFEDEEVVMSPDEFGQFYGDWKNAKKWKETLNNKGRTLNEEREQLRLERKQLKEDAALVKEYRELKQAFQRNPEAYKQINQLLNESRPSMDPAIEEIRKELSDTRATVERDKAVVRLEKEFEDFDYDDIQNFTRDFNFESHYDTMRNQYLAWKGAQLDELLSEARANVLRKAKNKKGLPSTNRKEAAPDKKPKTLEEALEMAHRRLEAEGHPRGR